MIEQKLKNALALCLKDADFPADRQRAVLRAVRKEETFVKKKLSVALICAIVLMLTVGGMALAASLGVFGMAGRTNPQNADRLARLEQQAVTLDATQTAQPLLPPEGATKPETLYQQLLSRLYARQFQLTVNQSYADGHKLYYAYTLTTSEPLQWYMGDGAPSGVDEWYMQAQGTYAQNYTQNDDGDEQRFASFFAEHQTGYIARETMGLGDGADLDGQPLTILDSGEEWVDERTLRGYQEVALPEGFAPEDGLAKIELTVMYGASVTMQDETSVSCAHIVTPENRGILRLSFTVPVNGSTQTCTGQISTQSYRAHAFLRVSDVDVSGQVVFDALEGTAPMSQPPVLDYTLMADGAAYPNLDGAFVTDESGQCVLYVRYHLPESINHLMLVPPASEAETIVLTK